MPIVYLEMIMGQYSQSGALSVWRVCPALQGTSFIRKFKTAQCYQRKARLLNTCIALFVKYNNNNNSNDDDNDDHGDDEGRVVGKICSLGTHTCLIGCWLR